MESATDFPAREVALPFKSWPITESDVTRRDVTRMRFNRLINDAFLRKWCKSDILIANALAILKKRGILNCSKDDMSAYCS